MQAIEHGQRLYFRDKHYESVLPSMAIADAQNGRRSSNSDPISKAENYQLYKDIAFPKAKASIDPAALAAFAKVSRSGFLPQWISGIVPRMEWLDRAAANGDKPPDEQYALLSPHLAIFAPKIDGVWLSAPLLVFNAADWQVGKDEELVDFETENAVMTVKIPQDGTGYMTDARLQVVDSVEVQ
jgi:hypothetical protein